MELETLDEAALIAATGVSPRNLTRWRQQGLLVPTNSRRGLGRGLGTTPLEYPAVTVLTIERINALRQTFKRVDEWRWRLWLEGHPVRIAPALAATLGRMSASALNIKTLGDLETRAPARMWKPANLP